ERAVEVAHLLWNVELELAATLRLIAADAVARLAARADRLALRAQLKRRDHRGDEVELPDGADVLAKAGALEDRVDHQRAEDVGEQEEGGRARRIPQRELFVGPEEDRHQHG